jgi:hypothetical protein
MAAGRTGSIQMRFYHKIHRAGRALLLAGTFIASFASASFTSTWAAGKPYANEELESAAVRLEHKLADDSADLRAHTPLPELRKQASLSKTLPVLEAIIASAPGSSADWLLLARAAEMAAMPNGDNSETLKNEALASAWRAYRHAQTRPDQAAALTVIGEVYASREAWREALNAYRASLDAEASPAQQKT